MGDVEGNLVNHAIRHAPGVIRERLADDYDTWEEFTDAVRAISQEIDVDSEVVRRDLPRATCMSIHQNNDPVTVMSI